MSNIKIPGFKIERFIAEGGMASVFLAVQKSLHRSVALKILKKFDSPEHAERFLREGRTIASLNHRNIITIHDIGVIDDRHYISMEFLEGGSLSERIEAGMQEPDILDLMESICGCLDFVHRKGIIHRDIKPSNILFHTDGTAKLTDFGIAKQLNSDQELTIDGSAFGSPYYISPEQAEGQTLDGRADIYALGIIFHEVLTGQKPFAEKSHIETILAHLTHPIPKLPKALSKYQVLMERMIAKDPRSRAASAQELLNLIQKIKLSGTPSQSKTSNPSEKRLSLDRGRSLAVEWGKRLHLPSMAQVSILDWVKELRLSPVNKKGIVITALLLLAVGTGIPFYGHLSQQDSEARIEVASADEKSSIEVSAPADEVNVSVNEVIVSAESISEDIADHPVEGTSDKQPLTVQSETSIPAAIPVLQAEEEPGIASSISEPLRQSLDKTTAKQPEDEKTSIPPVDGKSLAISEWLEAGNQALKAYRLTTPPEDNAYSHYQKVIELDSDNVDAKKGIENIADTYANLARNQIRKQNYRLARVYLRRGTKAGGAHARWSKLDAEIGKLEKSEQQAAELKRQSKPIEKKEEKSKFVQGFQKFWQSFTKSK